MMTLLTGAWQESRDTQPDQPGKSDRVESGRRALPDMGGKAADIGSGKTAKIAESVDQAIAPAA